ncbi:MAG: hypothetical protein WD844_12040 [Thermoleophilaceae bacterium]
MNGPRVVHRWFGVDVSCDFELLGPPSPRTERGSGLEIRLAAASDVEAAWSGPAPERAVADLVQDGLPYRAERGAAGDHRFAYGDRATFHLSAGGRTLLCAPVDAGAPEWRRVLLDSVLATVSLVRGYEALHAAAVLGPGGAVALLGRTGAGKTTLAAELLQRGLPLVCDDVLALSREPGGGRILAHPAPPVMNLPAGVLAPPGRVLAAIRGETWLAVDGAASEPAPVAAVCLVDRRPGAQAAVVPGPASPLDLLVHGLRSGSAPERRQQRFELLSDLAARTPAYVLEADTRTSAAELADLLEAAVPALARARAETVR